MQVQKLLAEPRSVSSHVIAPEGTLANILLQLMAFLSCCMVWYGHPGRGIIFPALLFTACLPTFTAPILDNFGWTKVGWHSKCPHWPWTTQTSASHGAQQHGMAPHEPLSTACRSCCLGAEYRAWKPRKSPNSPVFNSREYPLLPTWPPQPCRMIPTVLKCHVIPCLICASLLILSLYCSSFFSFHTLVVFSLLSPSNSPLFSHFTSHFSS